jgi:protein-S-isoprenylcysteine O-methyltransferase Ste14
MISSREDENSMSRTLIFIYGIVSFLIALGGLFFFVLLLSDREIHSNPNHVKPVATAIQVNVSLIVLFGLQHSIMARQWFKDALTKFIPPVTERSTYVLFSGVVMFLMSYYWQNIAGTLWEIENSAARVVVTAFQLFGWGLLVLAASQVNPYELMGLQQVYFHFVGKTEPVAKFTENFPYGLVRHPIQLGVIIGMLAEPTMTISHLLLFVSMTLYIFIGLYFEEKNLVKTFGKTYTKYQQRVPMVIPFLNRKERLKVSE